MSAFQPQSHWIAGVRVDDVTSREALDAIEEFVGESGLHRVVTPNVDHIMNARHSAGFRDALNSAALSLPDGKWIVRGARILGIHFRESTAGRLLVEPMMEMAAKHGWKVFILASKGDIAQRAAEILQSRYAGLKIVGAHSPSMRFGQDPGETEQILAMLERTAPDLLFLGMGAPKSEIWMRQYEHRITAKVAIGVGYAFDVIAGTVVECPAWMTKTGFEWAYRLCREPKRLWKRYLVRDPQFFLLMLRERFRRSQSS